MVANSDYFQSRVRVLSKAEEPVSFFHELLGRLVNDVVVLVLQPSKVKAADKRVLTLRLCLGRGCTLSLGRCLFEFPSSQVIPRELGHGVPSNDGLSRT